VLLRGAVAACTLFVACISCAARKSTLHSTLQDVTVLIGYAVKLNANRQVSGTMRGFDQFMNVVLDKAHDDKLDVDLGMVVRSHQALSTYPLSNSVMLDLIVLVAACQLAAVLKAAMYRACALTLKHACIVCT
jgi:small nuclear ribonucleoprotein (snRNP)-like protein